MELGNALDIQDRIDKTLELIKTEKNNSIRLALYNYIGNLYSALGVIQGKKVYPIKSKVFGSIENYHRFMKKTDFLFDIFDDSFIKHKQFHSDLFYDILINTEELFVDMVNQNIDYRDADNTFSESDFLTIFHDFLKSIGLEKLFDNLLKNRQIFSMCKSRDFEQYNGLTLFNPVTGKMDVLINDFGYNLDSMYTLAHEMGHVYDGERIIEDHDNDRYLNYNYRSVYLEVIPRVFERLFLEYLIKNNICRDAALDKMVDMEINNHDYMLSAYALSLLDDEYLKDDRYYSLGPDKMIDLIKDNFKDLDSIKELFNNMNFRLDEEVNYTYGDIVSMFLKDGVREEGFFNPDFRKFMRIRLCDFDPKYIEESGFTPEEYRRRYVEEIKILCK